MTLRLFGTILFYFFALGVAGYAVFAYGFMPLGSLVHPDMKLNFVIHPIGIYTHVFASLVALSLAPFGSAAHVRACIASWAALIWAWVSWWAGCPACT